MNQPIVTAKLLLVSSLREPTDAEIVSAGEVLARLDAEARVLGESPLAAPVHHAMGRIWNERLGDPRSAATCFQNAFGLDPKYRPNLEATRRLFAAEAQWERALAIHQREEMLLVDPAAKAESLRAQARILQRELKRTAESEAVVQRALVLSPEHPALLRLALETAERSGDRLATARLLMRSAGTIKDDVQRGLMLRRAVLIFETLHLEAMSAPPPEPQPFAEEGHAPPPTAAELEQLHEEALRRLLGACPSDPIATVVVAQRARASGAWDQLVTLVNAEIERSGSASERLLAAQILAFKQSRAQEALSIVRAGLAASPSDASLHALEVQLCAQVAPADLSAALASMAEIASGPSERADLHAQAAAHAPSAIESEGLLSEALSENPGDAASIALHARLVAARDPAAAAERFVSLGEALESHAPGEAADQYAEAGLWFERSGMREEAVEIARRTLRLQPAHAAAIRILGRELPLLGAQAELASIFEELAAESQPWQAVEFLSRAAALLSDLPALGEVAGDAAGETQIAEVPPMHRAFDLAQRAAEVGRALPSTRASDGWTLLAFRAGDAGSLGRALEARAAAVANSIEEADAAIDPADENASEAAEHVAVLREELAALLIEAAELARVTADEARAQALLGRARSLDPTSTSVRRALLQLPSLPQEIRIAALGEEAHDTEPDRAAALFAEQAALLEASDRTDEAVQACVDALTAGGTDLAVLRRMARLQLKRGELSAALAVLEQVAQDLPEGLERATAWSRAAEVAEWRLSDPARAEQLYAQSLLSHVVAPPNEDGTPAAVGEASANVIASALAARARILHWSGRYAEAAQAYESLARASTRRGQKLQAFRTGASLRAFRTKEPGRAAELLRELLTEEPGDLDAMAALLALGDAGGVPDGRRERAELRGKLASRCQDPRFAALLRADSAEDRFAAGERDQGVAELRRALALNPHDRVALDLVEEALRASRNRQLLVDHLAFRCACEEGSTRAALAMEQAELFVEDGRFENAAASYRVALQSDPASLLAVRGARRVAEQLGDKPEVMRLLSKEAGLSPEPGIVSSRLLEAARIAEELGENSEAIGLLTTVLESDPRNLEVAGRLRALLGEDAPTELSTLYERFGGAGTNPSTSAFSWAFAGRIQLDELDDAKSAFIFAGRALARVGDLPEGLSLRADAAESISRFAEAAEALNRMIATAPAGDANLKPTQLRLGRLYLHELRDAEKALGVLAPHLGELDQETLLALAPHGAKLSPVLSAALHGRLVELFPTPPESGSPSAAELSAWIDALAQAQLVLGDKQAALAAFRRLIQLEPDNRFGLEKVAELATDLAPAESIAAWHHLFEMSPRLDALHALVRLFQRTDRSAAAFTVAAVLVGLSEATPEETALHDSIARLAPAAELPAIAELPALRANDDKGAARELLFAAAADLARAFPTSLTGRAERVKGDNPVRRVCTALARALGLAEPALYLSKSEPLVVQPAASDPPGLIVGAEAPRKHAPRVQRFLYSRALAQLKYGTHTLFGQMSRLPELCAELSRLCLPNEAVEKAQAHLPARDEALSAILAPALTPESRARLAPLCTAWLAALPFEAHSLALAMRETSERAAMILCGDPAAALSIVSAECPGGLARPEVSRLASFAISAAYVVLRAR